MKISSEWKETMSNSGVDAFKRVGQENVKIPMTMSDAPTSQNWVITRIDTELLGTQCYHVEVQWLVCRSSLVDDFITGIVRRAKQLGLEFIQVLLHTIGFALCLDVISSRYRYCRRYDRIHIGS